MASAAMDEDLTAVTTDSHHQLLWRQFRHQDVEDDSSLRQEETVDNGGGRKIMFSGYGHIRGIRDKGLSYLRVQLNRIIDIFCASKCIGTHFRR